MANISRTFSVSDKLYEKFETICKSKGIKKSIILQEAIKNYIGENYIIDTNIHYKLKHISDSDLVKILRKEKDFIILDNGNKMNIFDFEALYVEEDLGVKGVLEYFESEKSISDDEEQIGADFLNKSFLEGERVKNIFNDLKIDNSKTPDTKTKIRDLTKEDDNPLIEDFRTVVEKKDDLINKWRSEKKSIDIAHHEDFIDKVKNKIKELNTKEYKEACLNVIGKTFNSSSNIELHMVNTIQYIVNKIILESNNNIFMQDDYNRVKISYTNSSTLVEIGKDFLIASTEIQNLISENYKIKKENIFIKSNSDTMKEAEVQNKTSVNFPEPKIEEIEMVEIKSIVKRIKEKRREVTIPNLKETLKYIFETDVKIEEKHLVSQMTGNERNLYIVSIPKKYHLSELSTILKTVTNDNYELRDLKLELKQ